MKIVPQKLRQMLVIVSPQLAALSTGGAVAFPSILLDQLSAKNTNIHLDLNTFSWIGSVRSFATILGVFMPTLMQWKGRKVAFITGCLSILIGWIVASTASSVTAILISETFHGLGSTSLMSDSMLSIGEMVTPRYRNVAMTSILIVQSFGLTLMCIMGKYLHWNTVSLIMCFPMTIAIAMALMWPESPSWLACKGKFKKCERAFIFLRGTNDVSKRELEELITAQKECLNSDKTKDLKMLAHIWHTLKRKDFYVPCSHIFVLLSLTYWGGCITIHLYPFRMLQKATNNTDITAYSAIIVSGINFLCIFINAALINRFNNKAVLLTSCFSSIVLLLITILIDILQTNDVIDKDSLICMYFLLAYMAVTCLGVIPIVYNTAAELMPVKHRGLGGSIHIILTCILQTSAMKCAPYFLHYFYLWGTLLIYAIIASFLGMVLWKYIPETKRRTLQEIEDYYNYGRFNVKRLNSEVEEFEVPD